MSTPEAHYRRLLRAYPPAYRASHGEEILGTLMEAVGSRKRPSLREAAGLVGGGLATRVGDGAARVPWWADGLHLAAFLIALTGLTGGIESLWVDPWSGATSGASCAVILTLALARGRIRLALPFGIVPGFLAVMPFLGGALEYWPAYAPSLVPPAVLAVLAVRPSRAFRTRSWWWFAVPLIIEVARQIDVRGGPHHGYWLSDFVRVALVVLLLAAGTWATTKVRDPRWLLAGAVYVLLTVTPTVVNTVEYLGDPSPYAFVLWGSQVVPVLVMAGAAYRVRRRA